MNILDFVSSTLASTKKFYSFGKYPLYFIGMNACDGEEACIKGIMGGETGRYQEFKVKVDLKQKELDSKIEKVFEFNKLVTENYRIDKVIAFGDYYLMVGDFGKMEVSKRSVEENKEKAPIEIKFKVEERRRVLHESEKLVENTNALTDTSVIRKETLKAHEYLDIDKGAIETIKHLIYKRGKKDVFMRGYGDTDHAKLEKIGKETIYSTIRGTSLKFYKIQDFSIKQTTKNEGGKWDKKPDGAVNLSFFAQKYINTHRTYLSQKDISPSRFLIFVGIVFCIGVLLSCFIAYKMAKKMDMTSDFAKNKKRASLIGINFEAKKEVIDKKILDMYFGGAPEEKPKNAFIQSIKNLQLNSKVHDEIDEY